MGYGYDYDYGLPQPTTTRIDATQPAQPCHSLWVSTSPTSICSSAVAGGKFNNPRQLPHAASATATAAAVLLPATMDLDLANAAHYIVKDHNYVLKFVDVLSE